MNKILLQFFSKASHMVYLHFILKNKKILKVFTNIVYHFYFLTEGKDSPYLNNAYIVMQ